MTISRSIRVAANAMISSFYGCIVFHCTYGPHLLYPLICRWTFSCFHVLAIINSTAMNIGECTQYFNPQSSLTLLHSPSALAPSLQGRKQLNDRLTFLPTDKHRGQVQRRLEHGGSRGSLCSKSWNRALQEPRFSMLLGECISQCARNIAHSPLCAKTCANAYYKQTNKQI